MADKEKITLPDGTTAILPAGLSDVEVENALAAAMPARMSKYGIFYDIEKEYNIRSGVPDAKARFDAALARGNSEEIAVAMNENFGEGNWGITPNTTIPFVTPDGLRQAGIEPKDDRKVTLTGNENSFYDIIDASPEIAIGAASLVAELALPFAPGTGAAGAAGARGLLSLLTGRGLIARSGRAGIGAGVGSLGVEGIQTMRGGQKESAGEIFGRAGAEATIIGLASVVLGAPIYAATRGASEVIKASKNLAPDDAAKMFPSIKAADLEEAVKAQGRVRNVLGEEDALFLSLRSLVGEENTTVGQALKIMEGLGARQMKEKLPVRISDAMVRYRDILRASAGLTDDVYLQMVKKGLTKSERDLFKKTIKQLDEFPNSPAGLTDDAASTLSTMKKFMQEKLRAQYKIGMAHFEQKYALWNSGGAASNRVLSNKEVADYMNAIVRKSDIEADDVLFAFSKTGGLGNRISSRVYVTRSGQFEAKKLSKAVRKKMEKDPSFNPYVGENITSGALLRADQAIRGATFNSADAVATRNGIEVSKAALDTLENYLPSGASLRDFKKLNKQYGTFVSPYRGRKGLFSRLTTQNEKVDADKYLQDFVSGKNFAEIDAMLKKLDDAFSGKAAAMRELKKSDPSLWKQQKKAKDDMISSMGFNFIRESKINLSKISPENVKTAAQKELNKIEDLENTLKKRYPSTEAGKTTVRNTINRIFGNKHLEEYKSILTDISTGKPNAVKNLDNIMSFKEAGAFVEKIAKIGNNLRSNELRDVPQELARLKALDPRNEKLARQMIFAENWSKVINSANVAEPTKALSAIKSWADDYIGAIAQHGDKTVAAVMPDGVHAGMKDLAIVVQKGANIDPVSGALSTAEIIPSTIRAILRLDVKGAIKPLSYMFATRQFAPYAPAWKALNKKLMTKGSLSPEELAKEMAAAKGKGSTKAAQALNTAISKGREAGSLALAGRNGLFAASIANYIEEANEVYPSEYEIAVRTLAGDEYTAQAPAGSELVMEEEQVDNTQPVVPVDMGVDAIKQIASMIRPSQTPVAGSGVTALDEGAARAGN